MEANKLEKIFSDIKQLIIKHGYVEVWYCLDCLIGGETYPYNDDDDVQDYHCAWGEHIHHRLLMNEDYESRDLWAIHKLIEVVE